MVITFNSGRNVLVDGRTGRMSAKITNDEIYGWTSDTIDSVADEYSGVQPILIIIGYILMILYCGLTFLYFNWVNSHVSVGLVSGASYILYICSRLGVFTYNRWACY